MNAENGQRGSGQGQRAAGDHIATLPVWLEFLFEVVERAMLFQQVEVFSGKTGNLALGGRHLLI